MEYDAAMGSSHPDQRTERRIRPLRIAIGGILHETNTFSPGETTLDDFRQRTLVYGDDLLKAATGGPGAPGGAISAAGGARVLPLLLASATPGGPVTAGAFEQLGTDLLGRLRTFHRQWPGIDGVVLFVHGAMVTTADDDPDGTLLSRVREQVGPDVPIVAVIDSHANVSERMVASSDALITFRQYPHTDTFDRGVEAMRLCLHLARGGGRPHMTWRKLPLLMPLLAQATHPESPFAPVVERAEWWRRQPGVGSVSLVPGFPFADIPSAGGAIVALGGDISQATTVVEDLAVRWWAARETFAVRGVSLGGWNPEPGTRPTILAEITDNPGAGGAGDGTHLLRHLLEGPYMAVALAALHDPAAVAACYAAGLGAGLRLEIGGRAHPTSGPPVGGDWRVTHLGDGRYVNEGAMSPGARGTLGRTATVVQGTVSVILSEHRAQTLDPGVFRAGGVEPEHCHWLAVKSSVHYRAGFQSLAGRMIDVECAGLSPSTLESLDFTRLIRPMAPLDRVDDPAAHGAAGVMS
jgi:microcystin degradation protein MlrC